MKLETPIGTTSEIWDIFIADSSSSTGAGLAGLTNASSGLTAYYHRNTDATATSISLVSMTVGTFTSSGFKEVDATNMPGWYQFCPPNAAFSSGAKSVSFHLKGATNMLPYPVQIQLVAYDPNNATTLGLTNLDAAITSRLAPTTAGRTLDVASSGEAGLDFDNIKDATGAHTLTNITLPVVSAVTGLTASNLDTTVSSRLASGSYTAPPSAATIAQAVWDALTSALTTVGSIGAYLLAKIDVVLSTRLASGSYTAPPSASTIAASVWDEVLTGHTTSATAGKLLRLLGSLVQIGSTVNDSTPTTSEFDTDLSASTPDFYIGMMIVFTSGNNIGLAREISAYSGASKTVTVDQALPYAPQTGDAFSIVSQYIYTMDKIAQAVWDRPTGSISTGIGGYILTNVDTTVGSRASQTSVDVIPTNPLLDDDARIDHLDTDISSRASQTSVDDVQGSVDAAQDSLDQIRSITRTIEAICDD